MAGTCYIDPNKPLSWDALDPYILPWVLGCPVEILRAQARLAAIEFCRRSGILHDENYFDLQKNVREYFLTSVCDYQVVRVYSVSMLNKWTFNPTLNKPLVVQGGPFNSVGYWGYNWWCGPYGFYMKSPSVIEITPATQQDFPRGLRVEFVVMPKQDSCTLDNYLYETWAESIAAGAISRCKMMKGPTITWSDSEGAKEYNTRFLNDINRARGNADMNHTSGPTYMTAARWV